jgi:RNA polymerase sigma-70 factor (ECF subfamily)
MKESERFKEAYLRERWAILSWLGSRLGEDSAEDLLQDVAARSLADLDALVPVRDLGAWLWRSVRNRATDEWRARKRRRDAGETDFEDFDRIVDGALHGAEDELEREEILDSLERAIASLPPEQAEVIIAQAINGETFASMAERTGVSAEALAARKRRAVANLGIALGAERKEER